MTLTGERSGSLADIPVTHRTVFLFDIDGVVCEPQSPVSHEMRCLLSSLANRVLLYFVTGNSFLKATDMLDGVEFDGMFSNNADELRSRSGRLLWQDKDTPPLPDGIDVTLRAYASPVEGNNTVEWRSPRMVNVSRVGRYASKERRAAHDASWREEAAREIMKAHPSVEVAVGGSVSIDVYSTGADKSRAGRWINEVLQRHFVFVGDKTAPGGNDYPLALYCSENPGNFSLTSEAVSDTARIIAEFLGKV